MDLIATIFWILVAVVMYAYIGYALLMIIVTLFTRKKIGPAHIFPPLTIVIPAFNEEKVIEQKLLNTVGLDYPAEHLSIIVVADGSTDKTVEKAKAFPIAKVLFEKERRGKAASLNRAMQHVTTPLVLFSDANTMLNIHCLQHIVKHFADERTGAVAGEKKVAHTSGVGTAEGWYWKYESFLKKLDGDFYTIVGAAGELFCLRSVLFRPLNEEVIIDDFVLSMELCLSGYRIAYEPGAYAVELPSASLSEEKKRKIRIASGAFQALSMISVNKLLHHPALFFQFVSRRWLRWVICPFAIVAIFLLNIMLAAQHPDKIYDILLWLQASFYVAALVGYLTIKKAFFITTIPFYFLFMNYCMLQGLFTYLRGEHSSLWTRSERETEGT